MTVHGNPLLHKEHVLQDASATMRVIFLGSDRKDIVMGGSY